MKYSLVFILVFSILLPSSTVLFAATVDPSNILSDEQMTDTHTMTHDQLQTFLSRGPLADYKTADVFGQTKTATDIIFDAAMKFQLNPQLLLVTLQKEQSLVESSSPSQNQFDWAMGYAVCDSCSKSDPSLQKYRGFGSQVYYAAQHLRDAYLSDLTSNGKTSSGIGPGIPTFIDGVKIIPANDATASLYTYTPHIHGNENFVRIWNRWFTRNFPTGSLVQDADSGDIWLIQDGVKRLITSKAAFFSRFSLSSVIKTTADALSNYGTGAPIRYPNYTLARSPKGTVYLLDGDNRRGFTSLNALQSAGFSTDDIIDVSFDDLSAYTESDPITEKTQYAEGTLFQNSANGGIFYVENGIKHPVMSKEILTARFPQTPIHTATQTDLEHYPTGDAELFPDGSLIGVKGSPDVFAVDKGMRRPIVDEVTFQTYGWNWNQVYWTNERSVLLQPLGEPISTKLQPEDNIIQAASE